MVFLVPLNTILIPNFESFYEDKDDMMNYQERADSNLKSSDIAGTDLYAEQINAYVAGNNSIIQQSLFTNDTNIFSQFDTTDPAFYKCNVLISASNAVQPDIFPSVLTESNIPSNHLMGFNNFVGFLYYDKEVDSIDAQLRAERALEIIKRKFEVDLMKLNVSEPNFFPFVGNYPNWEIFLHEITSNLPMDGYWKALDIARLTGEEYLKNHHLSSTFMIINSLDFFEGDFDISTDQLNFNTESIDLSFLENLEMGNLIDQFNEIIDNYGELFNATISDDELEQFIEILGAFTLSNDSHYTSLMVQYEGLNEGIKKLGGNQYKFNLWDSLGYEGDPLTPSEKIYIALIGAFMSDIEINILCTEIVDATPVNFEFYDYLLEQIGMIFYLAGGEFDVEAIKDYSFELFWVDEDGFKRSYVKLVNLNDPYDIVNLLQQLGFQGFSYIPTGITNPIDQFTVIYNISNSEPNLIIQKELVGENASYGAFRDFSYYISAKNVGNITAWGIPTPIPLELNDYILLLTLGNQPLADELQNTIWEIVRIEYPNQYDSLEDFFNFDEDPRIFYFDSFGTGVFDTIYPNLLNLTNLSPYNEDMDNIIDIIITGYPQLITALVALGLTPSELKDIFTNRYSIWNDDNWKLEPGKTISYYFHNVSIANLDSFTPFYSFNFSIETSPKTPEIIHGTALSPPEMGLNKDNESWIIESVEKFLEQRIEINFIFKNETKVDLVNNTLERVSIIINFTAPENLDNLDFEIFNFDVEEFQDMYASLTSVVNNTWTFSIINNNDSLDWLFYPLDQVNHTILFKIRCANSEKFNISIDDLDVEFSIRDINTNDDSGSRVVFSTHTGNVQIDRRSNSVPLSTYDMASIIATSYLTNYNSKQGEINTYTIDFKNIGSRIAENISISLIIPGIIKDLNNFTISKSNLTYYLSKLAPSEEKTINFSFYTPNSRSIGDVLLSYNNPRNIQGGNSSKLSTLINEVYVASPVDYESRFPFVRIVEVGYSNSSFTIPPDINDIFNLTVIIRSVGPSGLAIPDINISMNDQFGDLRRIDKNDLYFTNIGYNESLAFNVTLKKKEWKGYYYPSINFIEGSEGKTIQISNSLSKILGKISFSLIKKVDKDQVEVGDEITVTIEVENTGTISISEVMISDMISYSQSEFSLIKGKLVNLIPSLNPAEKISFNYTLKAKKQALASLNPASISYYYLMKREEKSNTVNVKINTPKINQLYRIFFPIGLVVVISGLYIWQIRKYKKKKNEFQRTEMHIFKLSSRDSVLKIEHTLRERLNQLKEESEGLDK